MKKSNIILISYFSLFVAGLVFLTVMGFVYKSHKEETYKTEIGKFSHLYLTKGARIHIAPVNDNEFTGNFLESDSSSSVKYEIKGDTLYVLKSGKNTTFYMDKLLSINGKDCKIFSNEFRGDKLLLNLKNSYFRGSLNIDSLSLNISKSRCFIDNKNPFYFVKATIKDSSYIYLPTVKNIDLDIDESSKLSIN